MRASLKGGLSPVELCRTLAKMGVGSSGAAMMKLMRKYDEDGSGCLEFDEVESVCLD